MSLDIAHRVYNHTFKLDQISRSLCDTDFYKFLMQQLIFRKYPNTKVRFRLVNRNKNVRLADIIPLEELRGQLDAARTVRFSKRELIYLQGNTFYGTRNIFEPDFISALETFQLPEYKLSIEDGQFVLDFYGDWWKVTAWEIPALAIINELRARYAMKDMPRFALEVLYARAKAKLWEKVERLRVLKAEDPASLKISDFGTRRRHGFLWQRWCIEAMKEGIGENFVGTSNVLHAMENDLEAIGTNAHELPMTIAALANGDEELARAPYKVLELWKEMYHGNLLVVLPDAFGSTSFLKNAPDSVADWVGYRPDSKDPIIGTQEYIDWIVSKGRNPKDKLVILSDGMDITSIEETFRHFHGRVRLSYGWGTTLTNDFKGCSPTGNDEHFKSMSLVCKVVEADGRPAVKLSDNPSKAIGPKSEVERYLRVFGTEGMVTKHVAV